MPKSEAASLYIHYNLKYLELYLFNQFCSCAYLDRSSIRPDLS